MHELVIMIPRKSLSKHGIVELEMMNDREKAVKKARKLYERSRDTSSPTESKQARYKLEKLVDDWRIKEYELTDDLLSFSVNAMVSDMDFGFDIDFGEWSK